MLRLNLKYFFAMLIQKGPMKRNAQQGLGGLVLYCAFFRHVLENFILTTLFYAFKIQLDNFSMVLTLLSGFGWLREIRCFNVDVMYFVLFTNISCRQQTGENFLFWILSFYIVILLTLFTRGIFGAAHGCGGQFT